MSNVTDMVSMFAFAEKFFSDLSMWDVSKVKKMHGMFMYAEMMEYKKCFYPQVK